MSTSQNLEERIADHYATAAPSRAPDWLLAQALDTVDTTPQRRTGLGRPWRFPPMPSTLARLGVTAVAVAAIGAVGLTVLRGPSVGPAAELGIFEPVAGRIVSGVWAVDPEAIDPSGPSRTTTLSLGPEKVLPRGWSSDGTELLFIREDPTDRTFPYARHLYILHADGTETQLNRDAMEIGGAAIAPDGSLVAFDADGLYVVDADGGRPVRIAEEGSSPTFSPDGSQIAYLVNNSGTGEARVWVADADGSDARVILADEPDLVEGVFSLAWSPAGDRIAIGNSLEGHLAINTFAPDGSDFTKVITGGMNPYWSPDGSQIAYLLPYGEPLGGTPGLAIADADGSNVREFGFGASGPWHPGTPESAPEPTSSSSAAPSQVTPIPSRRSEVEQIIAEGTLASYAATGSGSVLTVWGTCDFREVDCGYAWRLSTGSLASASGMVGRGDVPVDATASGDGFVLTPASSHDLGYLIAEDGTASPLPGDCRDATWSTPTEPGRLVWASGLNFVDTVAATTCPISRLGGPPLARGAFTADGLLWALVDNETAPETLTIANYDGTRWQYRDLAATGGSWTSVLAAAGQNVVVLVADSEPSNQHLIGLSVTTDAGATWSEVVDLDVLERDLPFSAYVHPDAEVWLSDYTSMAFAGMSVLYVADGSGSLWRSTDFATFSRVSVPGDVADLKSADNAVFASLDDNDLVRISADGSVEPLTAR